MKNQKTELPEAGVVFATALYLATNFAKCGCPMLCRMLMRQLACLERHPDPSLSPGVRDVCRKLQLEWERIGAERAFALHATGGEDSTRPMH